MLEENGEDCEDVVQQWPLFNDGGDEVSLSGDWLRRPQTGAQLLIDGHLLESRVRRMLEETGEDCEDVVQQWPLSFDVDCSLPPPVSSRDLFEESEYVRRRRAHPKDIDCCVTENCGTEEENGEESDRIQIADNGSSEECQTETKGINGKENNGN